MIDTSIIHIKTTLDHEINQWFVGGCQIAWPLVALSLCPNKSRPQLVTSCGRPLLWRWSSTYRCFKGLQNISFRNISDLGKVLFVNVIISSFRYCIYCDILWWFHFPATISYILLLQMILHTFVMSSKAGDVFRGWWPAAAGNARSGFDRSSRMCASAQLLQWTQRLVVTRLMRQPSPLVNSLSGG